MCSICGNNIICEFESGTYFKKIEQRDLLEYFKKKHLTLKSPDAFINPKPISNLDEIRLEPVRPIVPLIDIKPRIKFTTEEPIDSYQFKASSPHTFDIPLHQRPGYMPIPELPPIISLPPMEPPRFNMPLPFQGGNDRI